MSDYLSVRKCQTFLFEIILCVVHVDYHAAVMVYKNKI